jgi:myo-inositol-hexaphosphate 3-phosphohydrolase
METNNKIKINTDKDLLSNPIFSSAKMISPKRCWYVLLCLSFLLVVFVSIFDYCMYRKTVSGDMYVSVQRNELTIENLKINDIKNIISIFENKKNIINNLKIEKISDPSL